MDWVEADVDFVVASMEPGREDREHLGGLCVG